MRSNFIVTLFELMRARKDADIRTALQRLASRMRDPDMAGARDSLTRWVLGILQDEFNGTKISSVSSLEEATMLFNKRFKRYEDLLEYEAIQRGMTKGQEEGLQKGMQEGLQEGLQKGMQEGLQEGLQKGMQEGLQKGIQAGQAQGYRQILEMLLTNDAAQVPAELGARIQSAGPDQLMAWIKALLAGGDARQVLADSTR